MVQFRTWPILVGASLALAGCGAGNGGAGAPGAPAPDAEGMATFACAMSSGFEDGSLDPEIALPDDEGGLPLPVATVMLLGPGDGAPNEGVEEFYDPAREVAIAAQSGQTDQRDTALAELLATCDGSELAYGGVDVSLEGRVAFACALTDRVLRTEEPMQEWARLGQEDSSLLTATVAAGALLADPAVAHSDEDTGLQEEGRDLYVAVSRMDLDQMRSSLEAIDDQCR